MFSLEAFESQVSAVMEALAEAAVTELSGLLDKCSAAGRDVTAGDVTPLEERRRFNEAVASHFAPLVDARTRDAAAKILMLLKVSMCDGRRAGLNVEATRATVKPKAAAGPKKRSTSGSAHRRRQEIEGGLKLAIRQENEQAQHTEEPEAADSESVIKPADSARHKRNSGPSSEPETGLAEATSELASDVSQADVVQEDTDASTAASKIKKKKTTGPFKCPSCDKSFALKCLMDRHQLTHSKPHLCSECGRRFAGLRGLVAHSRRHTGEKLYRCSDCGTEFAYKYTFDRHMRRHGLVKPNTHVCTLCENQFTGVSALQRHRCCALKKTFVCSLCPETFECRQSLADHENLHSGDKDFVCEMCGESFFSYPSLATHRVTHTQKENCCDVLGLGCSDLSVLKSHLSKHTGEKPFTCEVCGKGCSHQSALKHHMLTHTGERPYVCETCGKRCGHASALQNHMRIHTGKKAGQQPVCNVCGKTFRCMVNLKYHKSIHTGVKPYACDQCEKTFRNPSNLRLHMTIHSGQEMYGCYICGRRFSASSSLKLHRRIHTGERP